MRLIFKDGFWIVHIPLVRIVRIIIVIVIFFLFFFLTFCEFFKLALNGGLLYESV